MVIEVDEHQGAETDDEHDYFIFLKHNKLTKICRELPEKQGTSV
jgi:hypothetical protein